MLMPDCWQAMPFGNLVTLEILVIFYSFLNETNLGAMEHGKGHTCQQYNTMQNHKAVTGIDSDSRLLEILVIGNFFW